MLENFFQLSQNYVLNYKQVYVRYFLKTHDLSNRFSIISGQRGIGKTTAIIEYMQQQYSDLYTTKALYIQADHFLLGDVSLYEIADEFVKMGGELLCIDEIHKYFNWSQELKSINDTFRELKLLVSGSSALEIHKGSYDLSRRALVYSMKGMSFREFLEIRLELELPSIKLQSLLLEHQPFSQEIIDKLATKKEKILPLFNEYLKVGYYPYYFEYNNQEQFYLALEQNIHTTIESDLLSVYPSLTGLSIKKLKSLLKVISASVPFIPDMKKLKGIIGVGDERTLKNYLKYLEDAGLIKMLMKSSRGLGSIEKPEKIYLDNSNLLFTSSAEIGTVRETFFMNQVSKDHEIIAPKNGDFLVDETYWFEVGGKNKSFKQIKEMNNSFVAADEIERGFGNKIPLWLFGFLY
ncbi:MAG: ATPase component BioM of energizing module of biotin ECF transporter [uncultured Sulfurovum sp.]|uniref:ATPase component BioM of energizing module of biotin ECF transporter n=1 Tax=uncultured Sulfurovum sp. TaxID=269237 RepID=A0A6S6TJC3_9BACT|nr:MAG: ATPase component BioM of energizing module of biotin ECF transporter [uncultured Sulfurovum sp.]